MLVLIISMLHTINTINFQARPATVFSSHLLIIINILFLNLICVTFFHFNVKKKKKFCIFFGMGGCPLLWICFIFFLLIWTILQHLDSFLGGGMGQIYLFFLLGGVHPPSARKKFFFIDSENLKNKFFFNFSLFPKFFKCTGKSQ